MYNLTSFTNRYDQDVSIDYEHFDTLDGLITGYIVTVDRVVTQRCSADGVIGWLVNQCCK